jgi:hypothetical protein
MKPPEAAGARVAMGEHGPSIPAGRRHVAKRIGCAAIAFAAAVTLGLSVHHELQTTAEVLSPASIKYATAADRQEECIYHAIRSELPRGAAVYISDPVVQWQNFQRLAELSTLWAVPQPSPATARWTIALVPGSSRVPGSPVPSHCYGLALEVRRR